MLRFAFLLLGLFISLGFSSECISEFCPYKKALDNSTLEQTKPKPIPVFKVPPPQLSEEQFKQQKKIIPLNNVVIINTPSAAVKVSLENLNRIVCPSTIDNFVYSKEKLIKVEKVGNNLYIRFLPVKEWNPTLGKSELVYKTYPRDLMVNCGGQVFTLLLVPEKGLPPQEIYLQLPYKGNKKVAQKFETTYPYEQTLLKLIKYAYKDEIPPGYTVKFVGKPCKEFKELSLYLNKIYIGDNFKVDEYVIVAKKQKITLQEEMFVPYFPKALALAIENPVLNRGDMTRLFIIERNQ